MKEEPKLLYVTEWVIARGIVVLYGHRHVRPSQHKEWYWLEIPGNDPNRHHLVCIGTNAFFTKEDAQEDAQMRWERHARKSALTAKLAVEGLERVQKGDLQVHLKPKSRLANLIAFEVSPFST